MSDIPKDEPQEDGPKDAWFRSLKLWVIVACALFFTIMVIINFSSDDNDSSSKKSKKETEVEFTGSPTRDNPIRVLLTNEWTEITQYSQITGDWKIQWGKSEIELTTDPYNTNEYWKPATTSKNLDAGQTVYGRTVQGKAEQKIAFFYE